MTDHSDPLASLIRETASGDRQAFQRLYEKTSSKLFGIILRILKRQDIAEDVLQDVYILVWKRADSFNPTQGRTISWMTAIARNRAIDVLRSGEEKIVKLSIVGEDAELNDALTAVSIPEIDPSDRMTLKVCLDEIEQKSRECVILAYQYGLSRDELATHYDVPSGTVKTWIRRALIGLRNCLER